MKGMLEDGIVHELLHVVRPEIGCFLKTNGDPGEDETHMHNVTEKLIRDFHELTKSEIAQLLQWPPKKIVIQQKSK